MRFMACFGSVTMHYVVNAILSVHYGSGDQYMKHDWLNFNVTWDMLNYGSVHIHNDYDNS